MAAIRCIWMGISIVRRVKGGEMGMTGLIISIIALVVSIVGAIFNAKRR